MNGTPTKNRTWNTGLEDPGYIRLTIGAFIQLRVVLFSMTICTE